jgi:signal transduction histidine kinase/CheY-like chemotaxis protein
VYTEINVGDKHKSQTIAINIVLALAEVAGFVAIILAATLMAQRSGLELFAFTFRPEAIVIALCLALLLGLLVPLSQPKNRSHITLWTVMFILGCAGSMVTFLLGTLSTTPAMHTFWGLTSFGFAMYIGVAYLFFVLAYLKKEELLYNPFTLIALIVPPLYLYRILQPNFSDRPGFSYTGGSGYEQAVAGSVDYGLWLAWIYFIVIIGFGLMVWYFFTLKPGTRIHKQTRLFVLSGLAPTVASMAGAFIPGLQHSSAVTSSLGLAVQALIMAYAILRYKIFNVNPATVSDVILSTMHEGVITVNARQGIERTNEAALNLLRITNKIEEDQPVQSLFDTAAAGKLGKLLQSPDDNSFELAVGRGQAKAILSVVATRIDNSDHSVAGYVLVLRDITKEQAAKAEIERQVTERTNQLHEEQAKLNASIESLSIGFIMIDSQNQVIMHNQATNTILNANPRQWTLDLLAQNLSNDTGDAQMDPVKYCNELRKSGDKHRVERAVTPDNRIVRLYLAPVSYHPGSTGIVVLLEDITEEEVLARSKDEFFSIASHELRTPLTAIRGNASMMMQFYEEKLKDPMLHDMVYDIHESSTRLIDIVNDFLDVSRLEQGKASFNLAEVPLDEVIESVIYEMRAVLNEKHLSLKFNRKTLGEIPKVWADKNRLKQIIYNLVGNAAKFTEQGGITVEANPDGEVIKVTVTDTGRGISAEGQRLLFHKFQQAGESLLTRDTTRGTGLGLYISKMLIEGMGGRVALESSTEGKGSTFSFTIPIVGSKAAQATADTSKATVNTQTGLSADPVELGAQLLTKPATDPNQKLVGGKLLVVEDDPYVLRLYERIFANTPIELMTAKNGQEGLDKAHSFHPDLIMLDVMMPVMNGIDVLTKLKADAATKDIAVFMLSNLGEESTIQQAMGLGALSYLIKSDYTPEQIRDKVTEKLKSQPAAPTKTVGKK